MRLKDARKLPHLPMFARNDNGIEAVDASA
jgi:hypothetical protein